jgi:hypothetical protein
MNDEDDQVARGPLIALQNLDRLRELVQNADEATLDTAIASLEEHQPTLETYAMQINSDDAYRVAAEYGAFTKELRERRDREYRSAGVAPTPDQTTLKPPQNAP